VQVDAGGKPEHVNCTLQEKPVLPVAAKLKVAVPPAVTEAVGVVAVISKPVVPVPFNGIVWGLLAALSVIETAPVAAPVAVGVKVTLMVHRCWGCTGALQELFSPKGPVVWTRET